MQKVRVSLQNCYGIAALEHEFDCTDGNLFLIYAPNGSMKTSFANVFSDIAAGAKPRDCIYPHRETKFDVTVNDAEPLDPARVLVVRPYEEGYRSQRTGALMVDEPLRVKYEKLISEFEESTNDVMKGLAEASGVAARSINKTFIQGYGDESSVLASLLADFAIEVDSIDDPGFADVPYAVVFHPKVAAFLSDDKTRRQLEEYIDRYNQLLNRSRFFRPGGFNLDGAASVRKSLADSRFFQASHSLLMADRDAGETPVHSAEDLDELVASEKKSILEDEDLIVRFEAIDSAMAKNAELREFRSYLERNRSILPELLDPDSFRRRVWLSYGFAVADRVTAFLVLHRRVKPEVEALVESARQQETEWREVVNIFHERFNVPFSMEVVNQADVILREEAPTLHFRYDDGRERCEVSDQALLSALSQGERRALYLLNVVFEVTARAKDAETHVLVLDDVADSFDYKNKYAIVEYLSAIRDTGRFVMIVLTHNFDFFRTVRSRLDVPRAAHCLMSSKSPDRIVLAPAQYLNPFDAWRRHLDQDRNLVAVIPMVRNLIEYAEGTRSEDYLKLTALLHRKPDTDALTRDDLVAVFDRVLKRPPAGGDDKIVDIILAEADACCLEDDGSLNLENKVVLSIAIRLLAETCMMSQIKDTTAAEAINSKQTRRLFEMWTTDNPDEGAARRVYERVLLMTPEAIHLNSFMYEPILDMSTCDLVDLYGELKAMRDANALKELSSAPVVAASATGESTVAGA